MIYINICTVNPNNKFSQKSLRENAGFNSIISKANQNIWSLWDNTIRSFKEKKNI